MTGLTGYHCYNIPVYYSCTRNNRIPRNSGGVAKVCMEGTLSRIRSGPIQPESAFLLLTGCPAVYPFATNRGLYSHKNSILYSSNLSPKGVDDHVCSIPLLICRRIWKYRWVLIHIGVLAENLIRLGFWRSVSYVHKINPNPRKKYLLREKVAQMPLFNLFRSWVGLALGWGVCRFRNNIYMFY